MRKTENNTKEKRNLTFLKSVTVPLKEVYKPFSIYADNVEHHSIQQNVYVWDTDYFPLTKKNRVCKGKITSYGLEDQDYMTRPTIESEKKIIRITFQKDSLAFHQTPGNNRGV
jgi:hypothetical protein